MGEHRGGGGRTFVVEPVPGRANGREVPPVSGAEQTDAFPELRKDAAVFAILADAKRAARDRALPVTFGENVAEGRARPEDLLAGFDRRFRDGETYVSESTRERAARDREALRAAIVSYRAGNDAARAEILALVSSLRRAETGMDVLRLQGGIISQVFENRSPREMAEVCSRGLEHPRNALEVAVVQLEDAYANAVTYADPRDIVRAAFPEAAGFAYDFLRSDAIPERERSAAFRLSQQIRGRYFKEAEAAARALSKACADVPAAAARLGELAGVLAEEERVETRRFERARSLQVALCDLVERASPERAAEVARRRELEEAFAEGDMEGEPVPLFSGSEHGGANRPHVVTLRHRGREYKAIVKFSFAEHAMRLGVRAGNGHWREVAGSAHAFGLGVRAPVAVARRLPGYGAVTLVEIIEGTSAEVAGRWFADADGNARPEAAAMAAHDYLLGRTDGVPHNVVASERELAAIDHGSDLSSDARERVSSAAWYALAEMRVPVPVDLRARVAAWKDDHARRLFLELVRLIPESMDGYVTAYARRVEDLAMRWSDPTVPFVMFPPYPPDGRRYFPKVFFEQLDLSVKTAGARSMATAERTVVLDNDILL